MLTVGLTAQSASAFTWTPKICSGFSSCDSLGRGNAAYETAYTQSFWTMTGGHNCTNYAAYRAQLNGAPKTLPYNLGSASTWGPVAQQHNIPVDRIASHGSIAWFAASVANQMPAGHVAYVESVDLAAGTVTTSEDNWLGDFDWRTYKISDVSGFIHFTDSGSSSSSSAYETAFEANTGSLWSVGTDLHGAWGLGMMNGTSPSITQLTGGGYEVAFQANTGSLWTVGNAGAKDWGLGMMSGTSPSVTALANGSYEVAFQANTGGLWTVGSDPHGAWGLGMMNGTSPSIALVSGGYEVAFQANTGSLWTVGNAGAKDWGLGMMSGTSPGIG